VLARLGGHWFREFVLHPHSSAESDAVMRTVEPKQTPRGFGTSILQTTSFLEIAFYTQQETHVYLLSRGF
jgi:hypothetical protein